MMRQAAPGEFRSNLHRGGSAGKIKLTPEERKALKVSINAVKKTCAEVDKAK